MTRIAATLNAKATLSTINERLRYDLAFRGKQLLKIDFVFYDFKHLESVNILDGLAVDSIEDIAVNKLLAISQRTASKDYVDLYFLLKQFTMWDLRIGEEHKFGMEMEPLYIASLFNSVDQLTTMPIMKKKLSLDTLRSFFTAEAKRLAMTMIKP
jgi:hypothetical protein